MGVYAPPNPRKKKKKDMPDAANQSQNLNAAAAIAGGIPLIGGILQGAMGMAAQKRTNQANMEMAKYAYSKDLEMWNRQNVYNSPEAQMQRLKSAGLNPNLVYGQGAVANAAGQMPRYNAPTLDYNYTPPVQDTFGSTLAMYQDFQVKQAQVDNLKAQNKAILQGTMNKALQNKFMDATLYERIAGEQSRNLTLNWREKQARAQQELFDQTSPYQLEFFKQRNLNQQRQYEKMLDEMEKLDADTEYQSTVNKWYVTKMFSQLGLQAFGKITDLFPAGRTAKLAGQGMKSINPNKRIVPTSKAFENTTRAMQQFGRRHN